MSVIFDILLFLGLVAALYFGGTALSQNANLVAAVGHIRDVFHMVIGNMKNFSQVFPVWDLAVGFLVVIITESIIIALKVAKFFAKFRSQSQ